MLRIFDYDRLYKIAEEKAAEYKQAKPFPHIVIDNFANPEILSEAAKQVPTPEQISWYKYDNALEKKLAMPHIEVLPELFQDIFLQFNSFRFLKFLETLTDIENLIPDPSFNGGGIHQIVRGGKLDVHADYNVHPKFKLDRRLNVLLYLNENWKEEYGGYFELWDDQMTHMEKKVLPLFNRLVVFSTTDHSYHGHPEPLTCPEGWTRKSMALYYYSNGRPESEKSQAHSTIFKKRPTDPDDPEVDALREKRSRGRVADVKTF